MKKLITTSLVSVGITASLLGAGTANAESGTYLVPSEISPGTYRVTSNDGSGTGYYAVCADYSCEPGDGIIKNDFFTNNAIMVIPPSAVSVELNGVSFKRIR